jgi:putative nucleotidyltransferase with HDIG domain
VDDQIMMAIPESPDKIDWDDLLARFSELVDLQSCPQDPVYHGEGDVYIHTKLVVNALLTGDEWKKLDSDAQRALFWAALFHDIAKPMRTREENGRIVSPGHAVKGAIVAQRMLYQDWPADMPLFPLALRQQIVNLVRYHGLPLWFWDKVDMTRAVIQASVRARCDWIAQLAEADVLGRICNDQAELLERVALFREYCAETDCLVHPYRFASDYSRFRYFQKPDQHPGYHAYDDTQCEVILMSGLPGAGKDTWLRQHKPDVPVIALDALRREMGIDAKGNQGPVIARAKEQARVHLREGRNFAWNATNITQRMRAQLIDLFTDYHARVRIVYLEAPWSEVLRRNEAREAKLPVPILRRLADQLEIPDLTEAQHVEWLDAPDTVVADGSDIWPNSPSLNSRWSC